MQQIRGPREAAQGKEVHMKGRIEGIEEKQAKNGRTYLSKLTAINRQDNKKSIEEFKKRGLTVIDVSEKDLQHYRTVGAQARRQLVGKLFTEQFLNSVEEALDDFRKNRKGPQ